MKEVPGSPAFLIGHTFLCHFNNSVIAGLEPQLHEVNSHEMSYFLNRPVRFHLVKLYDQEVIDSNA